LLLLPKNNSAINQR